MKRLLLCTVICLLLSACSNDESNISESGQVSKISYEAELSDRESPKKIIELNTADAPTLERDISLSVLGAEKRSDESRLISYTWIDNNAIALFVSAHDNSVLATNHYWKWRIVYSNDYKTRAFGRYEQLYLQSAGKSEAKLICNELFLRDVDDEPAYFLSPICFTKSGDKLVCSEESIYIDGTSNGAIIDLETGKIERFESYSILGMSPIDETKRCCKAISERFSSGADATLLNKIAETNGTCFGLSSVV